MGIRVWRLEKEFRGDIGGLKESCEFLGKVLGEKEWAGGWGWELPSWS